MRKVMIAIVCWLSITGVAACGSNGKPANKVASISAGGSKSVAAAGSDQDKERAFAKCMRDRGIDVPDPKEGGGLQLPAQGTLISPGADSKVGDATSACRSLLPNGGAPSPMSAADLDKLRTQAKCMRAHGIAMPDPNPNGAMLQLGGKDTDPQKLQVAMKACGLGSGEGQADAPGLAPSQ